MLQHMLEIIGWVLILLFIVVVFLPMCITVLFVTWELVIYPFWKGVFEYFRELRK